jgi:site-specific DNA recombinase
LSQVDKGIERLLTAYQEELLSLEQLRERMPMLRQRQRALRAELQAITDQANDRTAFLRLAETLTAFLTRLRSAAESLSVMERQKIVRLLVKEILVGEDTHHHSSQHSDSFSSTTKRGLRSLKRSKLPFV